MNHNNKQKQDKTISKTNNRKKNQRKKHTTPPLEDIRMRDSFGTKQPWSRGPTENKDEDKDEEEDGRVNAAIE